jgi:prepilin-type N-terminal cleavage/methylation domain-containing protein
MGVSLLGSSVRVRRSRRGFTLIEILIALVIVSVGLVGIMALLSHSLREAGTIVEDSVAATCARTVYEALREGSRNRSFIVKEDTPTPHFVRGFTWVCDGVELSGSPNPPALPTALEADGTTAAGMATAASLALLRASDAAIFLPDDPGPGATGVNEPVFIYPRPGGATTENAYPPKSDWLPAAPVVFGHDGQVLQLDIERVFNLNNHFGNAAPNDTVAQYSFAITVRRSVVPQLVDANGLALAWAPGGTIGATFPPRLPPSAQPAYYQNGLYTIEVLVFRNFTPFPTQPASLTDPGWQARTHEAVPGGRFVGLLAVGL